MDSQATHSGSTGDRTGNHGPFRLCMDRRGLTVADLASRASVSVGTVYNAINGRPVTAVVINALSAALGVTPEHCRRLIERSAA